ncbi:MAG: hypothetical protein WBP81_24620 [Solirubrobacteraceae bacterium]
MIAQTPPAVNAERPRLGMRRELDAITDAGERQAAFEQAVAAAYERGSAVKRRRTSRSMT